MALSADNKWRLATGVFVVIVLLFSSATYVFYVKEDPESDRARPLVHREDLVLPTDSAYLESAVMAGLWLVNNQKPDGSFWYELNPVSGEYCYEFSLLRQIGTTYGVILLYSNYRESVFLEAGELALGFVGGHLEYLDEDTAMVIGGGEANLGGAALAVMAYYQYSKAVDDRYENEMDALGNFILSCQEEDGRLRSWHVMGGRVQEPGDEFYEMHTDYYPGEAFLALAMLYEHTREQKYLECWEAAFDYYYEFYGKQYSPYTPFSPWATGAMMMMYRFVKDPRYFHMARSMSDQVLDAQGIFPAGFENESFVGGFYLQRYNRWKDDPEGSSATDAAYQPRSNTASKIEGTIDLLWMMRQYNLSGDEQLYLTASFLASDFLKQIQYTEEEASAYDCPREWVVGGVPGGVVDPQIRIDFCQHAIVSWLKVYCYLEQDRGLHY